MRGTAIIFTRRSPLGLETCSLVHRVVSLVSGAGFLHCGLTCSIVVRWSYNEIWIHRSPN